MSGINVEVLGETLTLLPERAVFHANAQTLYIADVHLGKEYTFRAHAVPLPEGTTRDDLQRLTQVIAHNDAQQLIVLGDLFHAQRGMQSSARDLLAQWRAAHPTVKVLLVRGNHDHGGELDRLLTTLDIACVEPPYPHGCFVLHHQPLRSNAGYTLAGHLHPGVQLLGKGRQSLKLPCFWFGNNLAVLPAFGSFTGAASIARQPGDRIFIPVNDSVIELTS
jgi:DNA ligase-associated metallophosphoesterase